MSGLTGDVMCYADVDAFGKVYCNANYVQDSTVIDAYLRWLPSFAVKPHNKRVAAVHMSLTCGEAGLLPASCDAAMPSTVEQVKLWTTTETAPQCVFCADLAKGKSLPAAVLPFHPALIATCPVVDDVKEVDIDALLQELEMDEKPGDGTKKKSKAKKKKNKSKCTDLCEPEDGGVELVQPSDTRHDNHAGSCEIEMEAEAAAAVPRASAPTPARAHRGSCEQSFDLIPASDTRVSETKIAELPTAQMQRLPRSPPAPMIQQPKLDLTAIAHESHYEVTDEGGLEQLHTVVEELAGVVRALATTVRGQQRMMDDLTVAVRGCSDGIAKLQAISAQRSAEVLSLAQEAAADRRVMMDLLQALREKS